MSLISVCVEARVPIGASWDVLIGNYIEVVLDKEREREGLNKYEWMSIYEATTEWLSRLAFELVSSRATGTKADKEMIQWTLQDAGMGETPLRVARGCGILRSVGKEGEVRYEHHRLQEYFAAKELIRKFENHEIDISEHLDDIWWREVVIMASGLMSRPDQLIHEILDEAERRSFKSFSDIRYEFNQVMLAMSCYRPARHKLLANTRGALIEYLLQFLRFGNILQKVRALRVAPQFEDLKVTSEIKRLLRDPSRWVRETALTAIAESAITSPSFAKTVWQQVFRMTKGERLLVEGLQEFPVLMRNRRTRWFVPVYVAVVAFATVKTVIVWLFIFAAAFWAWHKGKITIGHAANWILSPLGTYLFVRQMIKRHLLRNAWFSDSFNRWCLVLAVWYAVLGAVADLYNYAKGGTGSIRGVTASLIYTVVISLVYFYAAKNLVMLWMEWKKRQGKRVIDVSQIVPDSSLDGRNRQARNIIKAALGDPSPVVRKQLLDSLKILAPLGADILYELEEFGSQETDVDVRTKVWQVYEQLELAIDRGKEQ